MLSEKMRNEHINPFGLFLNVDCVTDVEEAIDKWKTSLRIAVEINKMDLEVTKKFLEKALINSVARYWQHLPTETKDIIFSATTSSDFITAAAEAFQLEFHGEGRLIKDPTTINKYCVALQRLQLCDMCEIELQLTIPFHLYDI